MLERGSNAIAGSGPFVAIDVCGWVSDLLHCLLHLIASPDEYRSLSAPRLPAAQRTQSASSPASFSTPTNWELSQQVDGSFLGHVTIRPCTCALSNMSEVAADNSRLTPEVLTEADGKGSGEATARVLAEIHKGTTGDDSPIVVRQTPQR